MGGRFGEILLILILVLLFFGPNKLPSLAKALGEALREFKKASNPDSDEAKPAATVAASAPVLPADAKDSEKKNS